MGALHGWPPLEDRPGSTSSGVGVFHDVAVRPSTCIVQDASQLLTDWHDFVGAHPCDRLVPTDGDESEVGIDVSLARGEADCLAAEAARMKRARTLSSTAVDCVPTPEAVPPSDALKS
jgi:hypothetical protein